MSAVAVAGHSAPPIARGVGRLLARLVGLAVFIGVVALAFLAIALPLATGGSARSITSDGMAPTLPRGSLVIDQPVSAASLHVGDIVTYSRTAHGKQEFVTHRIAAVYRSGGKAQFATRGDANRTSDGALVPADAIRGKLWFHVPYLGALVTRITQSKATLIASAVLLLAGFALFRAALWARSRK